MPEEPPPRPWLRLRAGVPVVRRDDRSLQVGSHPVARVVVPATQAHAALLERLRAGVDPTRLPAPEVGVVERLQASGLLVDPAERARCTARRAATTVEVTGGTPWQGELVSRLRHLGVTVAPAPDPAVDLVVALCAGEPDRDRAEAWAADDRTVLFVAVVDGRVRLGPFVVPGVTPCLHCLDAHARERDPRHPVLLEQWGAAQAVEAEPWLVSVALAWAGADVARWSHGRLPLTWCATVWLDEDAAPVVEPWARHPWCGCGWAAVDVTG